jgi:hypothetical protein
LVYLDHNVISLQSQGRIDLSGFDSAQWVYSKEHFAEIRRSNSPEPFLDTLDALSAGLLEIRLNGGQLSDEATLTANRSAHAQYADYLAANDEVEYNSEVFSPMMAWAAGGKCAAELRAMPEAIEAAIAGLTRQVPPHLVLETPADSLAAFRGMMDKMIQEGNDINRTRDFFGVGNGANNVSGSNELLQIWDLVKVSVPGFSADQFFGFEPYPSETADELPIYAGIIRCCTVLDVLGYAAESKVRQVKNVPNVMSDGAHIAAGAFCEAIVSSDAKLVRRAKAIYEFRSIRTSSVHLKFSATGKRAGWG